MGNSGRLKVVIVGAGPVGVTAALFLAAAGHEVQVYEIRDNVRQQKLGLPPPKTVFYALMAKGQTALAAAQVQLPSKQGERLGGLTKGGSSSGTGYSFKQWRRGQPFPHYPTPGLTWVERAALLQHLMAETQRLHPGRIHLHFEHSIQEVDWHGRAATFSRPDGTTAVATYDLLLAADGRHSKTRGLYQEHEPTFTSFQRRGDKDYLTFSGFMLPDDVAAEHVLRDERGLHIKAWAGKAYMFRLVLSQNSQGSVTGNLSAERARLATLHTQADFDRELGAQFPHVPASLRRLIAASVVDSPKADIGASGRVSSMVGPRFVIMGDAAHAVLPTLGQGANSGLMDTYVLSQAMAESGSDVDAALQLFQQRRHPEVLALHSLDMVAMTRLGFKGALHPLHLAERFHATLELFLAKRRGGNMFTTPHFRMLMGTLPYCQGKAVWDRDRHICYCLLAVIGSMIVGIALKGLNMSVHSVGIV